MGPKEAPPRRAEWAATVTVVAAMLLVPAGFFVLLSAQGGEASEEPAAPAGPETRSKTDRSARVTFHVRPESVGLRILNRAPRSTERMRGREVRVMCGGVSGLVVRTVRWPEGKPTVRVGMPSHVYSRAEFCAVKRGRRAVARVVLR